MDAPPKPLLTAGVQSPAEMKIPGAVFTWRFYGMIKYVKSLLSTGMRLICQ
jgi:hypothetical protein